MSQKMMRLRWIFIFLFVIASGVSIMLIAYNLGYSNATTDVSSQSSSVQSKVITTTLEMTLDPVVQALQGQPTSPLMLEAEIVIPNQKETENQTNDKLRFALFSSGLTLAASLLTALLGYAYNYFASKESRQFEWAKYVWGKYEQAYLEFVRVIRSTLDPKVLQTNFDNLRRTAYVPLHIRGKIDTYISQLAREESPEQKVAHRETLLLEFEAFLQHPWKDI